MPPLREGLAALIVGSGQQRQLGLAAQAQSLAQIAAPPAQLGLQRQAARLQGCIAQRLCQRQSLRCQQGPGFIRSTTVAQQAYQLLQRLPLVALPGQRVPAGQHLLAQAALGGQVITGIALDLGDAGPGLGHALGIGEFVQQR